MTSLISSSDSSTISLFLILSSPLFYQFVIYCIVSFVLHTLGISSIYKSWTISNFCFFFKHDRRRCFYKARFSLLFRTVRLFLIWSGKLRRYLHSKVVARASNFEFTAFAIHERASYVKIKSPSVSFRQTIHRESFFLFLRDHAAGRREQFDSNSSKCFTSVVAAISKRARAGAFTVCT